MTRSEAGSCGGARQLDDPDPDPLGGEVAGGDPAVGTVVALAADHVDGAAVCTTEHPQRGPRHRCTGSLDQHLGRHCRGSIDRRHFLRGDDRQHASEVTSRGDDVGDGDLVGVRDRQMPRDDPALARQFGGSARDVELRLAARRDGRPTPRGTRTLRDRAPWPSSPPHATRIARRATAPGRPSARRRPAR